MRAIRFFFPILFFGIVAGIGGCSTVRTLTGDSAYPLDPAMAASEMHCDGYFEATSKYIKDGVDQWHLYATAYGTFFQQTASARHTQCDGTDIPMNDSSQNLTRWDTTQIWTIEDSANGTFADTILSPQPFKIFDPHPLINHDSASISKGFSIEYATLHGCDSVWIFIKSNPKLAGLMDRRHTFDTASPVPTFLSKRVPANNSYYVRPESLAPFPPRGIIEIEIIAQNTKLARHFGKTYLLRSTCMSSVSCYLRP